MPLLRRTSVQPFSFSCWTFPDASFPPAVGTAGTSATPDFSAEENRVWIFVLSFLPPFPSSSSLNTDALSRQGAVVSVDGNNGSHEDGVTWSDMVSAYVTLEGRTADGGDVVERCGGDA